MILDKKLKMPEWLVRALVRSLVIFLIQLLSAIFYHGNEQNTQTPVPGEEYSYSCEWEEVPRSEVESRIFSIKEYHHGFEELTVDSKTIRYCVFVDIKELWKKGYEKKRPDYQKEFHLLAYEKNDDPFVKLLHLFARGTYKLQDQSQVLQDIFSEDRSVYVDPMPLPEDITKFIANAFGGENASKLTVSKQTPNGNHVFLRMNVDWKEWKLDAINSAIQHETDDWIIRVTLTEKIEWYKTELQSLANIVARMYSFDGDMILNGNAVHYTCEGGLSNSLSFEPFRRSKYLRCVVINAETKVDELPVKLAFSAKFEGEPSKEEVENLVAECFNNMDIQLRMTERTQLTGGKKGIVLDNEEWMAEAREISIIDDNLAYVFRIENRTDEVKIAKVDVPIVNKYRLINLPSEELIIEPGEKKTVMIKISLKTLKDYHLNNIESITVPVMLDRGLRPSGKYPLALVEKYRIFYDIYSAEPGDEDDELNGKVGNSQMSIGALDKPFSGKPIFEEETEDYYFAYEVIDMKHDPTIGCRIRFYVENMSDSDLNYKITKEYINGYECNELVTNHTFAGTGCIGDIDIKQCYFGDIKSVVLEHSFFKFKP